MEDILRQLEQCLIREIEVHEALAPIISEKLTCLRGGQAETVRDLCSKENALVQAGSELAKQRMLLAGQVTQQVIPDAQQPVSLGELVSHLPAEVQPRFRALRERLRVRMLEAKEQTSTSRQALTHLVRHMTGLVRTVGGALASGPSYGSQGLPPRQSMAVSTFSMTG